MKASDAGMSKVCLDLNNPVFQENLLSLQKSGGTPVAQQNGIYSHLWGIARVMSFYVLQNTDFFVG